jgi:hypothetical protein
LLKQVRRKLDRVAIASLELEPLQPAPLGTEPPLTGGNPRSQPCRSLFLIRSIRRRGLAFGETACGKPGEFFNEDGLGDQRGRAHVLGQNGPVIAADKDEWNISSTEMAGQGKDMMIPEIDIQDSACQLGTIGEAHAILNGRRRADDIEPGIFHGQPDHFARKEVVLYNEYVHP